MEYIGWQKRVKKKRKYVVPYLDEEKAIDIYVFSNPELVKYNTGSTGVHPKNNDYKHWQIVSGLLREKSRLGILQGIGFDKGCLFRINKRTNLDILSEKIGIKKEQLESILSNS